MHRKTTKKTSVNLEETLTRGVETILPSKNALQTLMQKKRIRVYLGIDPTGNQLHLGHAVVLRKLNQFAQLGHHVILLIGNGTVKIGDPTGRDKTRPVLTDQQIEKNFKTWKTQAEKILDFDKITIKRNADWLDSMHFSDIVKLLATTTVQQLIERDMFQERIAQGLPIFAHEILYPLLQGYDSVVMNVDLELGGNDQLFNMMMGRQLLKLMKKKEKFVLCVPLLVGSDGKKMGKSLNNFVALTESPNNMYGKIMGIVDEVMLSYFELLTDVPITEVTQMKMDFHANKFNPMKLKKRLAFVLTQTFHSEKDAQTAQEHFEQTVQKKQAPKDIRTIKTRVSSIKIIDLIVLAHPALSRGTARRLIEQGGVGVNGKRIDSSNRIITFEHEVLLKIGKRVYVSVEK